MYDIIIIGAGISGLTAALYAKRAKKNVIVIERSTCGGQIINSNNIENYPGIKNISGYELINNLINQIKDLDIKIINEEVIEITKDHKVITKNNEYSSKSIILSTGLSNRSLNLNEENFIGKGVSYCATCDGRLYNDKVVAVVGGGNTALEDAIYLSNIAKKVYIIHRNNNFRGEQILVDKVNKIKNIEIIYNVNIKKIIGNEKLEEIILDNNKTIYIDGLFIAIGKIPNTSFLNNLIKLDNNGYIVATENCHTNIDGIYASGDVRKKFLRQLVTASSDGAISANEAIKYINKES